MRLAILCLLLAGCASAPKPPEKQPQMRILSHKCDQWGVAEVTAVVTGPGVVSMQWDNAGVCGTPS